MIFIDDQHEKFYKEKLIEYKRNGGVEDSYSKSLIYVLGLSTDTRNNLYNIFDIKERSIKPEALQQGWQTGTSMKITRLAFNLWNGYVYDNPEEKEVSRYYAVDEIFSCSYAAYFYEAIKLRYPSYT